MALELPAALVTALRGARHVAVLTGAGVSAESGIPTFRDALTGLWASYRPEDLATPTAFRRNPRMVWAWYRMRRLEIARKEPNPGHHALVRLEALVPRFTLITQNVDGLHARAGSRDVVELHGNIARVKCADCDLVADRFEDTDEVPRCSSCGGLLRPDVVWFGEILPAAAYERAERAANDADVFLSVGTSNLVEPAASLPWIAAGHGARVAIVNPSAEGQRTGDRIHFLLGPAGRVLPELVDVVAGNTECRCEC
jgi:NAD-dependent deacetylase